MNEKRICPRSEEWGDRQNRFYFGDSAETLSALSKEYKEKIQLVYLDPPFMSGGTYRFIQKVGEEGWRGDPKYQISRNTYHDQWRGGISDYLAFLQPVIQNAGILLSENGCIAVHVDWRVSAHVRLLLDEVFGADHFVNEIIWAYQSGGRSDRHFSRKHDTIFLYRKGKEMSFYPDTVGELRGRGRRNHMKRNTDSDGRVYFSIRVAGKEYRYYEDEMMYPSDVWTDISPMQQKDPERTGYETQKPSALLERLILSTTQPGDWVLDPFSGSGTTAQAAASLNRKVVAVDKDETALHLFRRRMLGINAGFVICPLPEHKAESVSGRLDLEYDQNTVELMAWRVAEKPFPTKLSLFPHEDMLVDFWSVGYRREEVFYGSAFSMRTVKKPVLENTLSLPERDGIPCMMLTDVYGSTFYWELSK